MTAKMWLPVGILLALVMAGVLLFASQSNFVFRFTESDLERSLSDRLPVTRRYLFIFDVTIDEPRVDLVDGSDRVKAGVDLGLNIRIGESDLPLKGAVDVSGEVDYRSETGEFFLINPVIEDLKIGGVPTSYAEKAGDVIELAVAEYYRTRPIYRLEGTDAAKQAGRLLLKDVMVENQELVVTLGLIDD